MKGKIISFNKERLFGFIMGENGKKYFFHTSNVTKPFDVAKNKRVTFEASSNHKGACAKHIVIQRGKKIPLKQKNTFGFASIGNIMVDLNNVKSAYIQNLGLNKYGFDKCKLIIKTYNSGNLVNYYDRNVPNICDAQDDLRQLEYMLLNHQLNI